MVGFDRRDGGGQLEFPFCGSGVNFFGGFLGFFFFFYTGIVLMLDAGPCGCWAVRVGEQQ